MNNSLQILFKNTSLFLCFMAGISYGQQQTKTYNETFKVTPGTELEINSSHTDIEFETWDKNEVVIQASIELEGASPEEAEEYFERNPIEILGNSERIEINSKSGNARVVFAGPSIFDGEDFEIEIPDIEPFLMDIEIPDLAPLPELADLPPMPPLPPMDFKQFDYEAYKKDGEKYMKQWQKEFHQEFDKEYEKKIEDWARKMEERVKERTERMEERTEEFEKRQEEREKMMKERQERMEERREDMARAREARQKALEQRRADMMEAKKALREAERNIFYMKSGGESKNYKIKKTIKVKMPKSVKLKLNVRHGEVKLAGLSKDVQASLAYASLLASTIDGKETFIKASYSPVQVENWILGHLDSQFSEEVILNDVSDIKLTTTSSDIVIDRILKNAVIENNLGTLHIREIEDSFNSVNLTIVNGELFCNLPEVPFGIRVDSDNSKFTPPSSVVWSKEGGGNKLVYTGYSGQANAGKTIKINSRLSEVTLKN